MRTLERGARHGHSPPRLAPSGPSIRRSVPVGALLHAAHRSVLPVSGAVGMRLQHLVEPALHHRQQPELPGRRQREPAPRAGRTGQRSGPDDGAGRRLARSAPPGTHVADFRAAGRTASDRAAGAWIAGLSQPATEPSAAAGATRQFHTAWLKPARAAPAAEPGGATGHQSGAAARRAIRPGRSTRRRAGRR